MGFSISWMAVKGKGLNPLLEELELIDTDEREEFPESDICAVSFPNGWNFLQFNEFESPYLSNEYLEITSKDCEVIACVVEEHVMVSKSEYWKNGTCIWSVEHNAQEGMLNLESKGSLPSEYENIKNNQYSEQESDGGESADVDHIFEIPLLLAKGITSYTHDEVIPEHDGLEYLVLNSVSIKSNKPWWKVW